MDSTTKLAFRRKEAAAALGCSLDVIDRLLADGRLSGFKVGAARFISREEMERFVRDEGEMASGRSEAQDS